jgi:protein-L-isoaspartate(D-aspartate) O-methyltransferase
MCKKTCKIKLVIICVLCVASVTCKDKMKDPYRQLREQMVASQLANRGITDQRVLDAFREVPRHRFVFDTAQDSAYGDFPLSIGQNQTISQPYMVAIMTEFLELKGDEKVLEIGTGSGYQAAILSRLCKEVYTIEIIPELAQSAGSRLEDLGYANVYVKAGDGYLGWPDQAPFDAVIITCAPEKLPQPLVDQLKTGGRIVVPEGPQHRAQILNIYTKTDTGLIKRSEGGCYFVPMTGIIEDSSK